MGLEVSLRTVERVVQPFRQAWERAQKATMRFETMPGKQLCRWTSGRSDSWSVANARSGMCLWQH